MPEAVTTTFYVPRKIINNNGTYVYLTAFHESSNFSEGMRSRIEVARMVCKIYLISKRGSSDSKQSQRQLRPTGKREPVHPSLRLSCPKLDSMLARSNASTVNAT